MAIFDFNGFFQKINLKDWLVSVGSGYGRRFAEPGYDKIAEMPFFQKLKQQSSSVKYLIEAFSNAITAFADQKIDDATPLRKLIKEIFMDSSSELNKRLINGEPVKKLLVENVSRISSSKEQDFLAILLTMEEKQLVPFLEQLILLTREERADLVRSLRGMPAENMLRFVGFSAETRAMLLEISQSPKKTSALESMHKDLNSFLDERIARKRRDRDARRNAKKNPG
jgi:hypothetical protein